MVKAMHLSLPWKLVSIHSTLILLFMFTLWRRWFLLDIPFDDFYAPFFFTSGPIVYFIAWWLQHWSEPLFPVGTSAMMSWNLVPGCVCLLLGGVQWYWIGRLWMWSQRSRVVGACDIVGSPAVAYLCLVRLLRPEGTS